MLHYFLSRQSNEAQRHVKTVLFFHRPTYKWPWFCPEYWSAFFSWEQKSSAKGPGCHCWEITRAATCVPGDTWAARAGQLCSAAGPAPLPALQRCLFLFCWEDPGSFREHTEPVLPTCWGISRNSRINYWLTAVRAPRQLACSFCAQLQRR